MRINTFNLFLFTAFIKSNDGRPLVVALCPTHCSPVNAILPDPRTLDEYHPSSRLGSHLHCYIIIIIIIHCYMIEDISDIPKKTGHSTMLIKI